MNKKNLIITLLSLSLLFTSCTESKECIPCYKPYPHNEPFKDMEFVDEGKPWFVDLRHSLDSLYYYHLVSYDDFMNKFPGFSNENFKPLEVSEETYPSFDALLVFINPDSSEETYTLDLNGEIYYLTSEGSYILEDVDFNSIDIINYLYINGTSYVYEEDLFDHFI